MRIKRIVRVGWSGRGVGGIASQWLILGFLVETFYIFNTVHYIKQLRTPLSVLGTKVGIIHQ